MTAIQISPLKNLTLPQLQRLITGYTTTAVYQVNRVETAETISFTLTLSPLPQPKTVTYSHLDAETIASYQRFAARGLSFGAFLDGELVGIAISDVEMWNRSLWVREFHVAAPYRGQGIGRRLMAAVETAARAAACRVIVCETQNTNVPAIHFYQRMGFVLDGVDLSYYTNHDYPDGEIAVFMKRPLP